MVAIIKSIRTWHDDFWAKVDKHGPIVNPELGECWVWEKGTRDKDGYGLFEINGKKRGSHRIGYELQNGPIPKGHLVMHKCDNPPCVRGSHLETGTNADNLGDMAAKGRARGGRRTKDGKEPRNRR